MHNFRPTTEISRTNIAVLSYKDENMIESDIGREWDFATALALIALSIQHPVGAVIAAAGYLVVVLLGQAVRLYVPHDD